MSVDNEIKGRLALITGASGGYSFPTKFSSGFGLTGIELVLAAHETYTRTAAISP
jgi:NADP-dependent 3-hydroxy acid dehydrogenase YdfG